MKLSEKAAAIAKTFTLAGLLASAIATTSAQVQPQPSQQPPDSVVAVVANAQGLPLVPPDQLPFFGTFWEVRSSLPCLTAPLPFPPVDTNTPVYAIGDPIIGGQFLVDATAGQVVSPEAQSGRRALRSMSTASIVQAQVEELQAFVAGVQARQAEAALRANGLMDPLPLDNQDGGPLDPMGLDSYAAGTLWLSISQITNGVAPLVIHGTVPNVLYEIWSKQTLTDTAWSFEGSVLGAADQDWTPTTVTVGIRTNSLFLRCRSWVSSNGSGIPDWWLLQYFGTTDIDPYALCPSGDGWTILQAYQNGWNPTLFYTPPPPQNVTAVLDASGTSATITWTSGGGPVTNYSIFGGYFYDHLVSPTTFTVTDTFDSPPYDFVLDWPYVVRAYFANGTYADSQPARFTAPRLNSGFAAVRGPGGQLYIAVAAVPPDLASVRVYWNVWDGTLGRDILRSIDVNVGNFVNGAAPLPLDQMTGYTPGGWLNAQCISTNGSRGAAPDVLPYPFWDGDGGWDDQPVTRFIDASAHLKENLKFLLCSATLHQPFSYGPGDAYWGGFFDAVWEPETYFARPASPASYEYYGFHTFSTHLNYSVMQELRPAQENHLWRNFAYDPADFGTSGQWNNGVGYERDLPGFRWLYAPQYQLTCTNCDPLPVALSVANHPYLYARWIPNLSAQQFSNELAEIGISVSGTNICLGGGLHNAYGLALDSVLYNAESPGARRTLDAGGACNGWYSSADYFCKVLPPTLQTLGYYFASQTRYLSWELNGWPGYGSLAGPPPPLPGSPTFSITNTSPLLITGFGQPITVSGWAKQTIGSGGQSLVGGGASQYAYLEQYFDQAYTIGADGNPTTNSAGLLSPYGEFFPMQPGPAALLTMPDVDPPYQRGTGVVHVIKLQLDMNHDGTMDLSSAGPDNTSLGRPFVFWINNDFDRLHTVDGSDAEQDDLEKVDNTVPWSQSWSGPDYTFQVPDPTYLWLPAIPCQRDLEDYARLWIPGLSNITAAMPNSYTVKLTLAGDGEIRLFRAVEADGGTNYLFDEAIASNQVVQSASLYVGLLASSSPIVLTNQCEHLIWCGAKRGSAEVHLQILDGTNIVADTPAYIQLNDVKEMYERWTLGETANRGPYDYPYRAEEGLTNRMTPFRYGPSESTNTPYILFVHGWNMKTWEKDRFAETAFKRLYWQGYQGRFGFFRWPTDNGFDGLWDALTDRRNYDGSEFNAWKSAPMLSSFLRTNLNAQYPGRVYLMAHSMGNVVAGEALRLATSQVVNTYIASQAAVPAHTYDGTLVPYSFTYGINFPTNTPNIYTNWFAPAGGASRRINLYNTNDYALQRQRWEINQLLKPDQATTLGWTYLFDGYPYDNIQSYAPGAPDDTPPWDHFQKQKGLSRIFFNIVSSLTDRYEVMSFAAQSRSTALGRTANVGNLNGNVDLGRADTPRIWPPDLDDPGANQYSRHKWHSAQFRSTNMRQKGYWRALLSSQDGFALDAP